VRRRFGDPDVARDDGFVDHLAEVVPDIVAPVGLVSRATETVVEDETLNSQRPIWTRPESEVTDEEHAEFFAGREWYVDSFRGGANSAQTFRAGGYTFLHIAIQMQADDAVLEWVESVLAAHPGLPTILTTHDYLNPRGERGPNPIIDLDRVDPDEHNSAEELWQKLIARQDQIFLVLCGHHHGQALRIEPNDSGHIVHQILADYQDRGQAGLDAGQPLNPYMRAPAAIGDGWLRLLEFDLGGPEPMIRVRTYSTHYNTLSSELATYAGWYREKEQPEMTDEEFHAAEEFTLLLTDFRKRFGAPGGG